jgi:hypothetical protein
MSNDKDAIVRLFKLQAKINMMVMDGTRNVEDVADKLQQILVEKQPYLRHSKTVSLAPTMGKVTTDKANKVFTGWIDGDFKDILQQIKNILQQILVEKQPYLRHLKTVSLAPTKGKVMLANAKEVFCCIDPGFRDWSTDVGGEDTAETKVDVHEMTRNANYQTLVCSLGDPRKHCLTQGQIEEFCRSHHDLLRRQTYSTFFLFEANGELFVARVFVDAAELYANVNPFGHDGSMRACHRHRLVVKQQTA